MVATKTKSKKAAEPLAVFHGERRSVHATCSIDVFEANGGFKGHYTIEWFRNRDDKLRDCSKDAGYAGSVNASVKGAFDRAVMDAVDYVDRLRMDHLTDEQLTKIVDLRAELVEWKFPGEAAEILARRASEGTQSKAEPPKRAKRTAKRFSAAMPPDDDQQGLDPIPFGENGWEDPKDRKAIQSGVEPPHSKDVAAETEIPLDKLHDHPGNPEPTEAEVLQMMRWLEEEDQQEPITVRPLDDPIGHYQVLAGRTRLAAARRLGWVSLDARVRPDLVDDAAAIRFAATNNSLRRSETTIRQARWVAYEVEQGKSIEEAGKLFGWSRSHAANMLGLLKMPEPWLGRVVAGEIAPTVACRLNPYVEIADLMEAFDKAYRTETWARDRWQSKDRIGRQITRVIESVTRPMTPGVKHGYGYQLGGDHPRYFKPDPAAEEKLKCVEVPIGKNGAMRRVALNAKEYDRLNLPLVKVKLEARESKHNGKPAKKVTAKLTDTEAAAEAKRKRKEADAKLGEWIAKEWLPAFLRLSASQAVRVLPPGERWRYQLLLPRLIEACSHGMGANLYDFEAFAAGAFTEAKGYMPDEDRWRGEQVLRTLDVSGDPITDVEERQREHVALLLWPQSDLADRCEWASAISADLPFGGRLPLMSIPMVEWVAGFVDVPDVGGRKRANIADGWRESGRGGRQREMVRIFLERHSRDQLADLAIKICVGRRAPDDASITAAVAWVNSAGKKADQVDRLLELHTSREPLKLPKCLAAPSPMKKGSKR